MNLTHPREPSHHTPRLPWRRIAALALLALAPLGCSHKPTAASQPAPTFDDAVQQYLRLAVSLGERNPDSLDFYFGPEAAVRKLRTQPLPLAEIRAQSSFLSSHLNAQQNGRAAALTAQLNAIALRAQLLTGSNQSFDQESRTFFGVVAPPDQDAAVRTRIRAQIASLLGHAAGTPAHTYSTFDARFTLPPDKVPTVMQAALRECRAETLRHIALPAGEHIDVEYVSNKPWSGFSRYLGNAHSLIQINMDFPHTVDRLLDLACHEGYPGHHVFNTLRDQSLVQSRHYEEWYAQTTFSPQSFVSEAAASYAPELAFPPAERLHIERDILFPLAGLSPHDVGRYLRISRLVASLSTAQPSLAREYLDGHLEFVRAADALERETLMEHAETLLLYLNEYRTYMLAYTLGHDRLRARIERENAPAAIRWQRYQQLMTQPVTSLDTPQP